MADLPKPDGLRVKCSNCGTLWWVTGQTLERVPMTSSSEVERRPVKPDAAGSIPAWSANIRQVAKEVGPYAAALVLERLNPDDGQPGRWTFKQAQGWVRRNKPVAIPIWRLATT